MKATILAMSAVLALCACVTGPVVAAAPEAGTASQNVAQAQAQLDRARKNYQDGVRELARSLNLDLGAVEAHRRDLGTIMLDFTDEEVRLRQRFGDGDRIGSWPAMRQLSLAWRARARPDQRLLAAARARSDAVLFSVMVSSRDKGATNGELAALWDEAAALDPLAFEAHIGASRAALALGDRTRATTAAQLALSSARTPADRAQAIAVRDQAVRAF